IRVRGCLGMGRGSWAFVLVQLGRGSITRLGRSVQGAVTPPFVSFGAPRRPAASFGRPSRGAGVRVVRVVSEGPVRATLRTGSLQGAPPPARKRGLRLWSAGGSARAVAHPAEAGRLDAALGEEGADGSPQGVDGLLGRVLGIRRHVEDLALAL